MTGPLARRIAANETVCDGCYRVVPRRMTGPREGLRLCADCRALFDLDSLLPARVAVPVAGRVIAALRR